MEKDLIDFYTRKKELIKNDIENLEKDRTSAINRMIEIDYILSGLEAEKIINDAIKLTIKWQSSVNCELDNYKFGEDLLEILKRRNENVKNKR